LDKCVTFLHSMERKVPAKAAIVLKAGDDEIVWGIYADDGKLLSQHMDVRQTFFFHIDQVVASVYQVIKTTFRTRKIGICDWWSCCFALWSCQTRKQVIEDYWKLGNQYRSLGFERIHFVCISKKNKPLPLQSGLDGRSGLEKGFGKAGSLVTWVNHMAFMQRKVQITNRRRATMNDLPFFGRQWYLGAWRCIMDPSVPCGSGSFLIYDNRLPNDCKSSRSGKNQLCIAWTSLIRSSG